MKGIMLRRSAFARATMQGSGGYTIQRSGIVLPIGIDARRRNVGEPRWVTADGGILGQLQRRMRMYHFASTRFSDAIGRLPSFEPSLLRKETIKYMEGFDPNDWSDDPICTVVEGVVYDKGIVVETTDARGRANGKQKIADQAAFSAIMQLSDRLTIEAERPRVSYRQDDFREAVRRIEATLLSEAFASKLVGNQAMDFGKQDGITEIEESIQANKVERLMNDQLAMDESLGVVDIKRHPALVACVSNFSNFLDLFRKTIRNIELGVPVIVLSRSNTSQHCYRWFQMLSKLMADHGIPAHLVSFASCSIEQQRELMKALPESPCYFTGSREVAKLVKEVSPKLMASTGGPNTMLVCDLTPQVAEAVRMSACIENSGQCTALRHLVSPPLPKAWLDKSVFGSVSLVSGPIQSLEERGFANLVEGFGGDGPKDGYSPHPSLPISYRVESSLPVGIQENWRSVYLDVTTRSEQDLTSDEFTRELGEWLVREQPISLSVNGPIDLALRMWEVTGQAVFSWGTTSQPALSCQARPQDGECFGEFPPRRQLASHTRFPVIVPSPTPSYNSVYNRNHLETQALSPCPDPLSFCRPLLETINDRASKGFCIQLLGYLANAATGPKLGTGARTSLYGIQRAPLNDRKTAIFCGPGAQMADLAPLLLPFYATNARQDVEVIVSKDNSSVASALSQINTAGLSITTGEEAPSIDDDSFYNVVTASAIEEYPLVGQYVSLLFPIGHCKSVRSDDSEFLASFRGSDKWLRLGSGAV